MKTITFDETKWNLVPVEPTEEMLNAACQDGVCVEGRPVWKHSMAFQAKWKYQQMLSASPSQEPAQEVTLTDAVKALDDLQSAFMSHTQWNGTPPSEVIAARAIIAALREKEQA